MLGSPFASLVLQPQPWLLWPPAPRMCRWRLDAGQRHLQPSPGWEQPSSDFRLLGFAPGWVPLKPLELVVMQTSAFPKKTQAAYPAQPSQFRICSAPGFETMSFCRWRGGSWSQQDSAGFPHKKRKPKQNKINKTLERKCPAHPSSKTRPQQLDGSVWPQGAW